MPDTPILVPPTGRPGQAIRAILAQPHGAYTDLDVDTIVRAYWAQCVHVGVDPVMLVAQMIHETGNLTSWWAQRPRRNPAGIGVTGRTAAVQPSRGAWAWNGDAWLEGCSFASWAGESAPAHVGRVLAYALPIGQGTAAQQALIAQALAVRPLPPRYRGIAPTWKGLNGRWAVPGRSYAQRIAVVAAAIRRG
jgi:hypothetical protein